MKIDKINLDGKKDSIEVLDKIFSAKKKKKLVDNVLYKTNANYKGRHAIYHFLNRIKIFIFISSFYFLYFWHTTGMLLQLAGIKPVSSISQILLKLYLQASQFFIF
jgi:hypothetical protein